MPLPPAALGCRNLGKKCQDNNGNPSAKRFKELGIKMRDFVYEKKEFSPVRTIYCHPRQVQPAPYVMDISEEGTYSKKRRASTEPIRTPSPDTLRQSKEPQPATPSPDSNSGNVVPLLHDTSYTALSPSPNLVNIMTIRKKTTYETGGMSIAPGSNSPNRLWKPAVRASPKQVVETPVKRAKYL